MDINIAQIANLPDIQLLCSMLAARYRQELNQHDKIATGTLYNFTWEININGKNFTVIFNLPDYWRYVENGRGPGKMPPVNKIEQWLQIKHILPHGHGKIPTLHQTAFMIARHIGKYGTKPTHALHDALNNSDDIIKKLKDVITDAINDKLYQEIQKEVKLWN